MRSVIITTFANIALNKYWGKRDTTKILPTKSSLSLGVAALSTKTSLSINNKPIHTIQLGWQSAHNNEAAAIITFLELCKKIYNIDCFFSINTENSFPTSNGLASSASGFAALAIGFNSLCNLNLTTTEISTLARIGSGSACRSIEGGFCLWKKGSNLLGTDSHAEQIAPTTHWPTLRIIIVIVNDQCKSISSRIGMAASVSTSPLYNKWINESEERIPHMIDAINNKDLTTLGKLTEEDWHGMHKVMLSTTPSLSYWQKESYLIMHTIEQLRIIHTINAYYTTDAGPNVKIICEEHTTNLIVNALQSTLPSAHIIVSALAPNPIITEHYAR